LGSQFKKEENRVNKKHIMLLVLLALASVSAFAQEADPAYNHPQAGVVRWGVIGAAFLLGIAAAAGAIGQSRAIAASVEGIARNPSAGGAIRTAMIIGLALIESLVIYALLIAFLVYEL
jgi:F-type H+-transporting ATPase subunit c